MEAGKFEKTKLFLYMLPMIVFYGVMFVTPIVLIFLQSLGLYSLGHVGKPHFTLDYYRKFFELGGTYLHALWFSTWNSGLAALIIGVLSYLLALFFHFMEFKGKKVVTAIYKIPLFIPYLISAFAWWTLLTPGGYVQRFLVWLGVINDMTQLVNDKYGVGIIVANVWINLPYMVILLVGALKMIDPSVIEASRILGAGFWKTVKNVIFPLTIPSFIAGSLLVFIGMFGAFSVQFILGGSWPKYMSITIYEDVVDRGEWGIGSVQAVVYMISALLIAYFYTKVMRGMRGEKA
jgi:putative spermidine/putrescine transport system permease protein